MLNSFYFDNTRFMPFTLVYLFCNEKLLMLQKPVNGKMNSGRLVPPGGKVEPNEGALQAAAREFNEETGAELIDPCIWGTFSWIDNEDQSGIMYIAKAFSYSGNIFESSPEGTPRWIDTKNIDFSKLPIHQKYILPAILKHDSHNLYSAHAIYENGQILSYVDSEPYYHGRGCV